MNSRYFETAKNIFQKLWDFITLCHYHIEHTALNNQTDDSMKINKKMFLFLWYILLFYYVGGTLINPYTSMSNILLFVVLSVLQFVVLRIKTYNLMVFFFVVSTLLSITISSQNENDALKILGAALTQHNYFLVLPDRLSLRIAYVCLSIFLVQRPRDHLFSLIENGDMSKVEVIIKNFYFIWPLLYLVNHFGLTYLVCAYQNTLKDYREVQSQLADTNRQLQETNEKLKEALSLLKKSNQDLEASLKARELFIASVSHELRNPLNVMIGNIELLGLDPLNSKQLQMLNTCKICGEVLLSLINNVLDVAKINAQKLELNYLPGDFYQLVEKIWNVSVMKIKQKDLKGGLYIERDFPKYLEMDSHRLTQILLNLIGNASKFTNQGFVKVFITWHDNETLEDLKKPHSEYLKLISNSQRTRLLDENLTEDEMSRIDTLDFSNIQIPKTIKITQRFASSQLLARPYSQFDSQRYLSMLLDETKLPAVDYSESMVCRRKKEGYFKINVVDTGCGISKIALNRIFLPFEQADASITRRFGGTGLGLYITQQMIRKMGGDIVVYSEENVGTNFCMVLPAKMVTERDAKKKTGEVKAVSNKKELRALVVDDDHHNQVIICSFLTRLNIRSDIANTGKEAVELFTKNGLGYYTLITMDLQMPVMDGFAACKKIRKVEAESGRDYHTPIIVVTGNCTEHEKNECLDIKGDIRASYFYRKPFTFDECKNAVQHIIAKQEKYKVKMSKVLVVDDDPFNHKIVQDYLVKYGFTCDTCSNGEKALQKLEQESFDVVLLDCEMPQMDGYTAARHIARLYPHILIIGITGHTESKYIQKALDNGMKHVEKKPVDFKRLIGLISVSCSSNKKN